MNPEQALADLFREVDGYQPSPDLFARVQRSIAEDRAHRRRIVGLVTLAAVVLASISGFVFVVADANPGGVVIVPKWAVETVALLLIGILIAGLGPAIRRFSDSFISDLFGSDAGVARHFLGVLDVAYYLVFAGVALVDVDLDRVSGAVPLSTGLEGILQRIAFVLGFMGVLHSLTIALLPVLGLVMASVRHRARSGGAPPRDTEARLGERVAKLVLVILAVMVGAGVLLQVIGVLLSGFG